MSAIPRKRDDGRAGGVALVALTAVGQAVAAGGAAFAMRDVFAALHEPGRTAPFASLLILLLAAVAVAGFRIAGRSVAERVGQGYVIALRHVLFSHLTRMPAGAVAGRRNGALAIRFVGDLAAARNWVGLGLARIVAAAIVVPGSIVALVLLDARLAAAAAVPLLLGVAVMMAVGAGMGSVHGRLRSKRANLAIAVMERAPAAPELRLLGRDATELKALREGGAAVRRAAVSRVLRIEVLRRLPDVAAAGSAVAVLWLALSGDLPAAEAAGALAVLAILVQPLRDLASVWDYRCAWVIARDKLGKLLASPTLDAPTLDAPGRPAGRRPRTPAYLEFMDVRCGPLRDFDAVAEPGTKIAVIGPNGAGKSLCLALAAGLEATEDGRVELDGRDLAGVSTRERQRSIVFVGPRSPVLQGSLRRALTLGVKPRPDDGDIERAAHAYGLGPVLERLGGLDGRVAEGGRNLSSGEATRLHLVRAVLARPRLLILDEPDHALDLDGVAALRRLLEESAATTLFAPRDASLARKADVLWYIDGGQVQVAGPPGELIEHDADVASWFRPRHAA